VAEENQVFWKCYSVAGFKDEDRGSNKESPQPLKARKEKTGSRFSPRT
jgi:hypothetical protein